MFIKDGNGGAERTEVAASPGKAEKMKLSPASPCVSIAILVFLFLSGLL